RRPGRTQWGSSASMSTEATPQPPASLVGLAPLGPERLGSVPGVLGRIVRERADDYARLQSWIDQSVHRREGDERPSGREACYTALRRGRGEPLRVIAEVKRSSPSQGQIAPLEPVEAARQYVAGGAAALSVLTERRHFGGELAHLAAVAADRAGWPGRVPLLRKDFTVHPAQLVEAA